MAGRKILRGKRTDSATAIPTGAREPELDNDTTVNSGTIETDNGNLNDTESDESIITVDPSEFGDTSGTSDSGEPRKRRGRKPGTKNKRKEIPQDLTTLLYSIHLMGAKILRTPEIELEETEAAEVSEAIARVNEVYGGIVIPDKVTVMINLAIILGKTYIPRGIAIANRMKMEQSQRKPIPFQVSSSIPNPEVN